VTGTLAIFTGTSFPSNQMYFERGNFTKI